MKMGKLSQKLKSSIRKHYVRKKDFDSLTKEVHRLTKKVAKLEKANTSGQAAKPAPVTKKKVTKKKTGTAKSPQEKLTTIKGIGPVLEKKLRGLGVTRISQIADWGQEDIDRISEHLNFKGRIEREEWIKQAKDLASS